MSLRAGPNDAPDRYLLEEVQSRGGEGELWRGSIDLDGVAIPVAVKVLHQRTPTHDPDVATRWRQQAELLRTLDHPNLVKVREVFEGPPVHAPGTAHTAASSLYLVMNWVEGESAADWVARNPDRDVLASIRVIARVADVIDYLHSGVATSKPVLHRDIKPANVMVSGPDVTLVDFGLARMLDTDPMTIAGTPAYLAPEVVAGQAYSEAADRYALGATAFTILTGAVPDATDPAAMRQGLERVQGVAARQDLADHVLAMLDPEPARRPASAAAWARDLTTVTISGRDGIAAMPPPTIGSRPGVDEQPGEERPPRTPSGFAPPSGPAFAPPPATSSFPPPAGGSEPHQLSYPAPTGAANSGDHSPGGSTPPPDEQDDSPEKKRRAPRLVGLVVLLLLLGGGGAYGASVLGWLGDDAEPVASAAGEEQPEDTGGDTGSEDVPEDESAAEDDPDEPTEHVEEPPDPDMPSLVGSDLDAARAELDDLGVTDVTVEEEEHGDPAGTVLAQSPSPGARILDGVTLVVAVVPSAMPDVTGLSLDEAQRTLSEMGVTANVTEVLDRDRDDEQVITQDPEGGSAYRTEVDLEVSRRGVGRFLIDLNPVEGGLPGSGTYTVDGQTYTRAVASSTRTSTSSGARNQAGYDLGRGYQIFEATIGISDDAPSAMESRFEVLADGEVVFESTLNLGETEDILLDVSRVLRLELVVTDLRDHTYNRASSVFADPRLIGLPGEVPDLDEQ